MVRRHGVASYGIRVVPHSGGNPAQVTVSNNTIVLDGNSLRIYSESPTDIGIRDNDITFNDPAPDGSCTQLRATSQTMDGLTITCNTVNGPLSATGGGTYYSAVRLDASPFDIGGVTVALNSSRGGVRSLSCSHSTGTFTQPIVSLGNRWNTAPTCSVATLQSGQ